MGAPGKLAAGQILKDRATNARQQAVEKVSLTIEADILHRVRDRVEPGKVSAYATLALRRQLERDGLDDLIGELVEVNGPLNTNAVARYVEEWR